MIILTTTYNCEKYIEKCIYSIMSQSFKDFTCYITDDLSTDNTVKIIEDIIKDDKRFILIKNKEKMYQPGNYDQVIRELNIDDSEICVEVDGDDWLPDRNVLQRINKVYEDENIWLANGSFKYSDGRNGFAKKPEIIGDIRNTIFTMSHIRTWKSFLWKKINQEDLKDENGKYWEVAGDLSFMFPMIEMCGIIHYKFMDDINYIYNENNPINDHKVNLNKVQKIVNQIRNKKPYQILNERT
jgi:glycosyltransferase involved in cell wall biosynthesis